MEEKEPTVDERRIGYSRQKEWHVQRLVDEKDPGPVYAQKGAPCD